MYGSNRSLIVARALNIDDVTTGAGALLSARIAVNQLLM